MRVARVYTNETCNQRCAFCHTRRPREDPAYVAGAAVARRIDAAARSGAKELILTGGEPAMRRDLPRLVAYARARGIDRVTLETNATLIDPARARALADAGLGLARVHAPAWSERYDRVTHDPGGFTNMVRGTHALAAAGIELELSTPIVRENLDAIAELPARFADALPRARAWVVGVPYRGPAPALLVDPAAAARAIEAAEAAARRAELTIRLEQDTQLPPCTFERPARVAHLFTLTRGAGPREGYRQLRACEPCIVRAQCPGFPEETLARVGEHDDERGALARPIAQDRVRRRLNVISSVEEQIARELTQEDVVRRPGEAAVRSRIVRVNFRCNQACHFCFVSTHLPAAEDAAVEDAIRGIARVGGKLVLSGGEPTLNPRLLDYVRLGKREGARAIELQTNAIRLAEPGLARALAEAGVDEAFISLHGSTAEISDAVTNAPGTFARTVVGIDQVVAAGITTRVNFVFCRANLEDFPAYVELVAARWPAAMLVVSFVATSTDVVPRTAELQPRYSEVIPPLADGLRRAAARGLVVTGFDSMCGIPLCLVPRDVREFFTLATVPEGFDGGEFIKAAACERCELQDKCFGVRRGYAELHGTDEFRPVRADTPA